MQGDQPLSVEFNFSLSLKGGGGGGGGGGVGCWGSTHLRFILGSPTATPCPSFYNTINFVTEKSPLSHT